MPQLTFFSYSMRNEGAWQAQTRSSANPSAGNASRDENKPEQRKLVDSLQTQLSNYFVDPMRVDHSVRLPQEKLKSTAEALLKAKDKKAREYILMKNLIFINEANTKQQQ